MASREEVTLPATRPKSRKSLGHIPSSQSMDQENMTADIGALAGSKRQLPQEKPSRKSRSKSIGPGGLDALKDTSGNRRKSLAAIPHPPPRSILKPTITPLPEIPAHKSTHKGSPKKSTPLPGQITENLIDFAIDDAPGATISGAENLANPFQVAGSPAVHETRVTLRTEEEQNAASREREEKERKELEKEVMSRRDARRKSLANRRVSFAPEATLHTWDVVVEYQDSTTSSNATNSTRRASSALGASAGSPHTSSGPGMDASEPPSTPPEQVEEDTIVASPAHQRGLHQKKRRRSSAIPPMNFNNPDDDGLSSSPYSGSSAGDADEIVEDDGSISNSDNDNDDDGTVMSLDGGDTTNMSLASAMSVESSGSSSRLDEALRQAARQAGTQDMDFNEPEDSEALDEDIVASFAPWSKQNAPPPLPLESERDQENINPFSPAFRAVVAQVEESDADDMTMDITMDMTRPMGGIIADKGHADEEMSMDVTRAFGGIIQNSVTKAPASKPKSLPPTRRQSTRRRSVAEESAMGDETMDLTMAIGGIQPAREETTPQDDEDMTMEFTSVIGGVFPQSTSTTRKGKPASRLLPQTKRTRQSLGSTAEDETMDMTVAVGGIMPATFRINEDQDATLGMDMTQALGGILAAQNSTESRTQAKQIMEMEADLGSSPFRAVEPSMSPPKVPFASHTAASETGSPSMAVFRGKGLRRSAESRLSSTPKSKLSSGGTPIKKPATPSKQITPHPIHASVPSKTPPSKNVVMRTSSPKRLFKDEIKAVASTPQSARGRKTATPNKLFQKDAATGAATPSFVLTPKPRRSSGVGLDKAGLGSPRVAALLDRRGSIGDQARSFVPSQLGSALQGVRFQDPQAMEDELDREREQESVREDGRAIMEREADQFAKEKDATLNLKEMIETLTPKKKPLRGRKSLHVGAAKGILGKRPAELDEDEEDEDTGGVKRLKSHQQSPVKNVRLQAPPTKAETTTGRLTRAARKSLDEASATPTMSSPVKSKATTPRQQGRFKDVEAIPSPQKVGPLSEKSPVEDPQIDEGSFGDDRIQLQDFLNMTSIRFMELTTTKRRHTIAPSSTLQAQGEEKDIVLEDCVAAGAATIPMLELFQHACQELKRYISEGRKTVRDIETETFEENPPLFHEYISATPDIKVVMDNQLKNVKTHARLLSKGLWYDWRMTLLGTLKEGLFRTAEGMIEDEEILDHQQELLEAVLPELMRRAEQLQSEEADLQSAAAEIADCDQEELSEVRQQLITIDAEVEAKQRLISDLHKQLEGRELEIQQGNERKRMCLEEIRDAEKIREECRGWTSSEISLLKNKVDAIEKEHGWTITGVSGTTTSMTYRKDIELVFDASSFLAEKSSSPVKKPVNSRIDLWYIGANRELNPLPLTPEKDSFLQSIRDHIRGLPQSQTQIRDLLKAVSVSWNKASKVVEDIRLLTISCPTEVSKTSDDSILIKSSLLIVPLATKVHVSFQLTSTSGDIGIDVEISPHASVIYGERFNEPKMGEFLLNRCGAAVEEKRHATKASWGHAVAELRGKLLARGRK